MTPPKPHDGSPLLSVRRWAEFVARAPEDSAARAKLMRALLDMGHVAELQRQDRVVFDGEEWRVDSIMRFPHGANLRLKSADLPLSASAEREGWNRVETNPAVDGLEFEIEGLERPPTLQPAPLSELLGDDFELPPPTDPFAAITALPPTDPTGHITRHDDATVLPSALGSLDMPSFLPDEFADDDFDPLTEYFQAGGSLTTDGEVFDAVSVDEGGTTSWRWTLRIGSGSTTWSTTPSSFGTTSNRLTNSMIFSSSTTRMTMKSLRINRRNTWQRPPCVIT